MSADTKMITMPVQTPGVVNEDSDDSIFLGKLLALIGQYITESMKTMYESGRNAVSTMTTKLETSVKGANSKMFADMQTALGTATTGVVSVLAGVSSLKASAKIAEWEKIEDPAYVAQPKRLGATNSTGLTHSQILQREKGEVKKVLDEAENELKNAESEYKNSINDTAAKSTYDSKKNTANDKKSEFNKYSEYLDGKEKFSQKADKIAEYKRQHDQAIYQTPAMGKCMEAALQANGANSSREATVYNAAADAEGTLTGQSEKVSSKAADLNSSFARTEDSISETVRASGMRA